MAVQSAATGAAVATGVTVFGVSTGLDPALLIAGLAGGLWAQSYQPAASLWRRLPLSFLASILAGYFAPAAAAVASSSDFVRGLIPSEALQLSAAVVVGLTAHRVLGPAFMRFASKKVDEVSQ